MPRVNLIGASNRQTNQTCVFGSMAGLAPTTNVRPSVTGLPGYKYMRAAANGVDWETGNFLSLSDKTAGCGLGRSCDDGKKCIALTHMKGTNAMSYRVGKKMLA